MNVRVRSRTVSGNEFQLEGPEVAKLRDPYIAPIDCVELSDRDGRQNGDVDDQM